MAISNLKGLSLADRIALIGVKNVIDIDELVLYTGLTRDYLKLLTQRGIIPSYKPEYARKYKNNTKNYYKKAEIDEWLTSCNHKNFSGTVKQLKPYDTSGAKPSETTDNSTNQTTETPNSEANV